MSEKGDRKITRLVVATTSAWQLFYNASEQCTHSAYTNILNMVKWLIIIFPFFPTTKIGRAGPWHSASYNSFIWFKRFIL